MYRKTETEDRSQIQYGSVKLIADSILDANNIPLTVRINNAKVYCILEETWLIANSNGVWHPYKDAIGYAQGLKGDKGDTGDKGDQGDIGPIGLTGQRGPVGLPGAQGTQGIQGIQGVTGDKGEKGDKGDQGEIGPIGFTGSRGPRGYDGPTQWTVGTDDPTFNTVPDFYINTVTRGVFGPKEEYLPQKKISPILSNPLGYDSGILSLGMKIKIKRSGTITHLKFYKMREEQTLTRKLKIWDENGVLIEEIETTNESAVGWQKYVLLTPLVVNIDQVLIVSYGVNGIYGMTNPMGTAFYPEFFELLGSGWSDVDMESFPNIQPTPDLPMYFIDFQYDEKDPIVWPLLGYLSSTQI